MRGGCYVQPFLCRMVERNAAMCNLTHLMVEILFLIDGFCVAHATTEMRLGVPVADATNVLVTCWPL